MIPVYKIRLPEYRVDTQPDFDLIGGKIDIGLKKNFMNKEVVVRVIGSQEHPNKTVEELIEIIKTTGTDRYDPEKKGDRYENIEGKHIDFFAMPFLITESGEYFKFLVEPFYSYPSLIRGAPPIRIDIATIYDPIQLEIVEHQYEGREGEIKKDGYIFKDKDRKPEAIIGIIHIE